jgi:hypothetical protein
MEMFPFIISNSIKNIQTNRNMNVEKLRLATGPQQETVTYPWSVPTVAVDLLDTLLYLCFSGKDVHQDCQASEEEESIMNYQQETANKKMSPSRPFQSKPVHFRSDIESIFRFEDDKCDDKSVDTEATVSMNSLSWDSADNEIRTCDSLPSRPAKTSLTESWHFKRQSTDPDLAQQELIEIHRVPSEASLYFLRADV